MELNIFPSQNISFPHLNFRADSRSFQISFAFPISLWQRGDPPYRDWAVATTPIYPHCWKILFLPFSQPFPVQGNGEIQGGKILPTFALTTNLRLNPSLTGDPVSLLTIWYMNRHQEVPWPRLAGAITWPAPCHLGLHYPAAYLYSVLMTRCLNLTSDPEAPVSLRQ